MISIMHAKMEATENVLCNLSKGLTHNIVSASLPTTNSIKPHWLIWVFCSSMHGRFVPIYNGVFSLSEMLIHIYTAFRSLEDRKTIQRNVRCQRTYFSTLQLCLGRSGLEYRKTGRRMRGDTKALSQHSSTNFQVLSSSASARLLDFLSFSNPPVGYLDHHHYKPNPG